MCETAQQRSEQKASEYRAINVEMWENRLEFSLSTGSVIKALYIPRVNQQPTINYRAKVMREKESAKHSSGLNPAAPVGYLTRALIACYY